MNTILIDNLKTIRNSKGLTQKEVAAHLGVVTSCYANWEQGRTEPDTNTLTALANYFGVTTDYLLGLEDDFGHKTSDDVIKRPQYDITDKQLQDLVKLFGVMTELQKAHVIGYIIAYLEREGINVGKVLGY